MEEGKEIIRLTETAKNKMLSLLNDEDFIFLRFGLKGGGCSGMQYFFTFEHTADEVDHRIDLGNGKFLLIDYMSVTYVSGSEIDYTKDAMGERFVFNNPHTVSKCGCGQSSSFI